MGRNYNNICMEVAGSGSGHACVRRSYPAMGQLLLFRQVRGDEVYKLAFLHEPDSRFDRAVRHQYGQLRDGADLKHAGEFGLFVDID